MKTHGPNSHPSKDSEGHHTPHETSQSKINHFSKNQHHIILSSDVPVDEKSIAEINEKSRHIPSILELKSNFGFSKSIPPPQTNHYTHTPSYTYSPYEEQEEFVEEQRKVSYRTQPSVEIKQVNAPDLSKFTPVSGHADYIPTTYSKSPSYISPSKHNEMNEGEYFSGYNNYGNSAPPATYRIHTNNNFNGFRNSDLVISKIQKVNVKPYSTPGLRHYSTVLKSNSRSYPPR